MLHLVLALVAAAVAFLGFGITIRLVETPIAALLILVPVTAFGAFLWVLGAVAPDVIRLLLAIEGNTRRRDSHSIPA